MALPPRSPPLKEADLLIPDGEVKGEQLRQVFRRLFSMLNPFFDSVTRFGGSVSLSQNDRCDLITASFTHGVPTAIRLQKLQSARSAIVRNCSGATPIGTPTVQMRPQAFVGAPPVVLVTVFFTNPAAVGVQAMVELREEGPALSAAPITDGVNARYQQVSAQTIPTGAETVVNFDTIISDSDLAVTPGVGWRFVVPSNKSGLYLCTASVTVVTPSSPTTINHLRLACRQNTAVVGRLDGQPVPALASVLVTREGMVPVFANTGDVIDFVLYQDSGGNLSTAASSQLILGTTCTIVRLLGY